MRVRIFMSENIHSVVDWYYRLPYTKLSGAKRVKCTINTAHRCTQRITYGPLVNDPVLVGS